MDDKWVPSTEFDAARPRAAVFGGHHHFDLAFTYVGRCYHEGESLPAKVIPSQGHAYVTWGGTEHAKPEYEVLVGHGYAWVPCHGGIIPPKAVRTGTTCDGEPLYVGRGQHRHGYNVGKILPSHGCLYIPFNGQEIRLNWFEVLINEKGDNWVPATPRAPLPPQAVIGGCDSDGNPTYVGRCYHDGKIIPAEIKPSEGQAYVTGRGVEHPKTEYEVLVGDYAWVKCGYAGVPANAIQMGETYLGDPLYIGRGHHATSLTVGKIDLSERCLYIPVEGQEIRLSSFEVLTNPNQSWVPTKISYILPSIIRQAIVAGYDADRATIYVARAVYKSEQHLVKFIPNKGCAQLCYRGQAVNKRKFEVLISHPGYIWVKPRHHIFRSKSLSIGKTPCGEPIYVGRGHYRGCLIPGLVSVSQQCLFIQHEGREIRLDTYEILCKF